MSAVTKAARLASLFVLIFALGACSGGGGSGSDGSGAPSGKETTPGVWKGTISSTVTRQTTSIVALTGQDGHSVWMSTDGRVWQGQLPLHGDHYDATLACHMFEGDHFPDGTNRGSSSINVEHQSSTAMRGHHAGVGDSGSFEMNRSSMWDRPASLDAVAGVYTRTTSNGYTMTMAIDTRGEMTGSDSKGCTFSGSLVVPDPQHNMYRVSVDVSSCGTLDGHHDGLATLLDADAMQDWMTAMHPLEHGGHTHGAIDDHHMGHNTVPAGRHNLLLFSMANDHDAIMDALHR